MSIIINWHIHVCAFLSHVPHASQS